jgi:ribonuclease BN (tRNA processing enzyme)
MKIYFLGTAGGRKTTFKKIRNSGGFLIKDKVLVHVDPGPGAFVYFFQTPFIPWKDLKAIVLSHLHLDHSADVNTLIESATESGKRKDLKLLAPKDAVYPPTGVVLPYCLNLVELEILKTSKEFPIESLTVRVLFPQAHHKVEIYALEFKNSEGKSIVYIPCGKFEENWLSQIPKEVDLMILNTTFYRKRKNIEHLSVEDAKIIIQTTSPKKAIITHFSLEMLLKNPVEIAKEITKETGVETMSAYDLMCVEI